MKILVLSHNFFPFIGGIEVITEMYCRSFTDAGHDVHLITWKEDPNDTAFPFKVIRKPNLIELFKAHAWADILFENNPSLRLSWPSVFFNRPSIIVIHTWIARMDGSMAKQDKIKLNWLKRATKVVAVSESIRKATFPSAEVIGNPYRADQFKILDDVERVKDFVFLGRLVSDKGVDMAIHAISRLNNKCALTIIGEGPELVALTQLVADLKIQDQVVFKGALRGDKLVRCLNEHRFIVIPSKWEEPFGLVALEGMACGCLPIVADGGGLSDAVGKAGIKFKKGSVDELINCMNEVTTNHNLEMEVRNEAKANLAKYHPTKIIGQYLNLIKSIHA
jgi:glycosyltransferase involved in cell wall biosynthesis